MSSISMTNFKEGFISCPMTYNLTAIFVIVHWIQAVKVTLSFSEIILYIKLRKKKKKTIRINFINQLTCNDIISWCRYCWICSCVFWIYNLCGRRRGLWYSWKNNCVLVNDMRYNGTTLFGTVCNQQNIKNFLYYTTHEHNLGK